ncbi:hypothetical protein PMAYCL1PPCAC_13967, partial [Pristionchus mayeri]
EEPLVKYQKSKYSKSPNKIPTRRAHKKRMSSEDYDKNYYPRKKTLIPEPMQREKMTRSSSKRIISVGIWEEETNQGIRV